MHSLWLLEKQQARCHVHYLQHPIKSHFFFSFLTICLDLCRQTLLCNLYVRGWDAEAQQSARDSVGMGIDHASQSFISLYMYFPLFPLASHLSTFCTQRNSIGLLQIATRVLSPLFHYSSSSVSNEFATNLLNLPPFRDHVTIRQDGH
jgi:hypothetical protein